LSETKPEKEGIVAFLSGKELFLKLTALEVELDVFTKQTQSALVKLENAVDKLTALLEKHDSLEEKIEELKEEVKELKSYKGVVEELRRRIADIEETMKDQRRTVMDWIKEIIIALLAALGALFMAYVHSRGGGN